MWVLRSHKFSSHQHGMWQPWLMQASTHKAGDARAGQVFAYGQTGSGKTYTMGTAATFRQMSSGEEGDGIIPRSVRYIFDSLTAVQDAYDISIKVRALLCTPGRSHHLCMCAGAAYGVHAPAKTHTADMVDARCTLRRLKLHLERLLCAARGLLYAAVVGQWAWRNESGGVVRLRQVSFIEIYQDDVRDLLGDADSYLPINVRESPDRGTFLENVQ